MIQEITIARALTELKTLDKKINKKISESKFAIVCNQSSKKVDGIQTREEFNQSAKSSYDSIVDLIARRNEIKTKIVASNAITRVIIANKEYTVAEAIERKSSIGLDKMLLTSMRNDYNRALALYESSNNKVEQQLNEHLETMFGTETKQKDNDVTIFTENFRKQHGYEIIDPLKLKEKVDKLTDEIDSFETEVDACLSESNAITKITISDDK
ncbi:hypothetical protein [Clostridium botulinum]|uniref:hypothetical protein n=1 Tax=Clostridium botulinum TaxID=1491 RepID=UPI0004D7E7FB|nr:hypothetical protein [Clostridium botulinum]KEH99865.1 putative phage-related protein [Clostridium botulinum C/D str. BKT75002]KEI05344.1 putative phage-related protein [Clostridium botulinum C/D str. BKT2873]QPW62031.1 hypothetical protein IG390_14355 [Clostridium botulinum]